MNETKIKEWQQNHSVQRFTESERDVFPPKASTEESGARNAYIEKFNSRVDALAQELLDQEMLGYRWSVSVDKSLTAATAGVMLSCERSLLFLDILAFSSDGSTISTYVDVCENGVPQFSADLDSLAEVLEFVGDILFDTAMLTEAGL